MKNITPFICLLFLVIGCKNDKQKKESVVKKPSLSAVILDSTNFKACADNPCPKIRVSYLTDSLNDDFAHHLNQRIQHQLVEIIGYDPNKKEKPKNVKLALQGFIRDYIRDKKNYPEDHIPQYEANIKQQVLQQNRKLIILKTEAYIFAGGAHGYGSVSLDNFDAKSGRYLPIREMLKDSVRFAQYAEKEFRKKYKIPDSLELNSKFMFENDKFVLPANMAFKKDQVLLHYNPYEVASYADGSLEVTIPRDSVARWLKY